MVVVINVDAFPFLALSHLTSHLEDTRICLLVALCPLMVRKPNL